MAIRSMQTSSRSLEMPSATFEISETQGPTKMPALSAMCALATKPVNLLPYQTRSRMIIDESTVSSRPSSPSEVPLHWNWNCLPAPYGGTHVERRSPIEQTALSGRKTNWKEGRKANWKKGRQAWMDAGRLRKHSNCLSARRKLFEDQGQGRDICREENHT